MNIPYSKPYFPKGTEEDLLKAFRSTFISGNGIELQTLESKLSAILNKVQTFSVTNGSAALRLAYQALEVNEDDNLILSGWGFHVAANIAKSMSLNFNFCDVELGTWCIDLEKLEPLLSISRRNVLVLIHNLGSSVDLQKLGLLREKYEIIIIEDAAEAFMSKYQDRYLGTFFDLGTYSFHAAKTVTTGEGGFVTTNDEEVAKKIVLYRSHGMLPDRPYHHLVAGDNYRLSNLLASVGLQQLEHLDEILEMRLKVYESLKDGFFKLPEASFIQPSDPHGFFPWGFGLRILPEFKIGASEVRERLLAKGIATRSGFSSAEDLPYKPKIENDLKNSNALSQQVVLLPHYPDLSLSQIEFIVAEVLSLIL